MSAQNVLCDPNAERAVLGAVLADKRRFADVAGVISPGDFGVQAHAVIFGALLELDEKGQGFDPMVVATSLQAKGKLGEVGGLGYLAGLETAAPIASNAAEYARAVASFAARRRIHGLAERFQRAAMDGEVTPEELAVQAQRDFGDAVHATAQGELQPMPVVIDRTLGMLDQMRQNGGGVTGVSTGLEELDRQLTGLHAGELIILAARPGIGKTSLALNMAASVALKAGKAAAFFSLEMPADQLALRLLSSESGVSLKRLREGGLSDHDMGRINDVASRLWTAPIHIDDTAALSLFEMRRRLRRLKQKAGEIGLVVVDYLQLMGGAPERQGSREQEVGFNSRGLKQLAKELSCPVLCLSQLNRKVEERKGGRPMLSDLRESGSIEQDADVVLFISPEQSEAPEEQYGAGENVELIVAKQRNGPVGVIPLTLRAQCTRFEPRRGQHWEAR